MENVAKKTAFDRWADAFGIDGARRDRLWSIMSQQALTPDDVNVYFLGAAGVLEKVADQIEAANDTLPQRIEAAAKEAVGPVARAAAKATEAHMASRHDQAEKALAGLTAGFERRATVVLDGIETRVADLAETKFARADRRDMLKTTALGVGAIAIVAVLAAWGAFSMGHTAGRAEMVSMTNELTAAASRPDAGTVALLLGNNPNFVDSINAWCGTGTGNLSTVEGARRCGPFWIDTPPVAGQSQVTALSLWNTVNGPLRGFDPLALILAGLGIASAIAWLRNRNRKPY